MEIVYYLRNNIYAGIVADPVAVAAAAAAVAVAAREEDLSNSCRQVPAKVFTYNFKMHCVK